MSKLLTEPKEVAIITMSSRGGGSQRDIERRTMLSLEKDKLVQCIDDRWGLTTAGKCVAASIAKYKPSGALAGLLDTHREVAKRSTPPQPHQLRYMAEKIRELFGPAIDDNPEAKRAFLAVLAADSNTRQIAL